MSQYLLDTNIASYIIKGNPAVRQRLVMIPMYEVAISAVTEGELRYGVARLPARTRLNTIVEEFLIRVAVFPWDSAAAQKYGQIRAALERAGDPLANLDTMIAAHALARGSVLVTYDKAFARVKGLRTEDWTKP
jgi:tRNA(fMet)-specific endonuclease VapC